MGRPPLPPERKRPQVTLTPDPDILSWLDSQTGPGQRWHNRTHAFEFCAREQMIREGIAPPTGQPAAPQRSKYVPPRP